MNNTPNQNFDIIIPEPPEELKIKKRSKLPLIISLSAVVALIIAAAVIAAMLYAPLLTTPHWGNTFNKVFFNVDEMQAFSDSLSDGVTADIDIGLKKELTGLLKDVNVKLSIASKFTEDSESGSLTLALKEGKNSLALSLIYDKDSVAIGVYGTENDTVQNDTAYVSIPRKNICEEFKNSVFAPESGSEFALEKEIFDEIVKVLKTFEDLDKEPENTEKLEDPLMRVAEQIAVYVRPSSSISFSNSEFALVRDISFTLTRDDMISIIDIIVAEAEANPRFAALLDPSYSSSAFEGTGTSLIDILKEAKTELPECETNFSYSVSGDYVRNVKYSFVSFDDPEENMDAVLDFVYGETVGFDLKITYGGESDDSILYRKTDNDSELKAELNITSEGEEFKTSVTLNKTDDSLIIHANASDNPESVFEMRGSLKYDKAASRIAMSIESIQIGKDDPINDFSFGFEFRGESSDVSMPQAISLFDMTAKDLEALLTDLPKETFAKMLKSCTGEDLENYLSADGKLMLNAAQYTEIATAYANAYSVYLSNTEIMRADAVYVPVPELGINILLNYNKWQNMIFYNFAYNMTDELLKAYHPAYFDESGNIVIHDINITETPPTCELQGQKVYECTVCGESYTEVIPARWHTLMSYEEKALCDDGNTYTVRYRRCEVCGLVEVLSIGDGIEAGYYFRFDKKTRKHTIWMTSFTSLEGICGYFSIPTQYEDMLSIGNIEKELDISPRHLIRIPKGVVTIANGTFIYGDMVQVLILPSTIKEIKAGAFSTYRNIHTVFYCGTEEEWKQVIFPDLEKLGGRVNVVFAPNGVTPEMIDDIMLDPEKVTSALNSAQKSYTSNDKAVKALAKKNGISLIHSGKIENAVYDKETNSVAVYSEYNGKSTTVTVYDVATLKKITSFSVNGDINVLDMSEGYIAYGFADSAKTLYLYSLAEGSTEELSVPLKYTHSRDQLAFVMIDSGKVYTVSSEQHCYFVYYSISAKEFVTINQIYEGSITINRDLHRITVKTYTTPMSTYVYDTEKGTLAEGGAPTEAQYVTLNPTYRTYIQSIILTSTQGSALFGVSPEYKAIIAMKNGSSDTVKYVEGYADSALVTENGDFIIFTRGGYGLLLIEMN